MRTGERVHVPITPRVARASGAAFVREAVFATRFTQLDTAVVSARGRQRVVNEDGHSALEGRVPLFVVADGVSAGALASRASGELVTRLHAALGQGRIDADAVRRAVLDADRDIGRSIARRSDAPGAATLALCAATSLTLSRWVIAWVGDCRVYRVRGDAAVQAELLTQDDTYRHLNEPSPPGGSPDDPARMIGNGAVDAPNVRHVDLHGDEMLVLCSDGVHRHVSAGDIGRFLRGRTSLARRCVGLVQFARDRGSHDDATVLVVRRAAGPRSAIARTLARTTLGALMALGLLQLAADSVAAPHVAPTRATSSPAGWIR